MDYILQVKNLTKIYEGGVLANQDINFDIVKGEIHGLVGENGAGKSTLMKMLYGMESITSGEIYHNGKSVNFKSSKDAIKNGIGMVHQHFMLVDSLTGAENFRLGVETSSFILHRRKDVNTLSESAKKYQFNIDGGKCVRDMSVGMKQKLEILKILNRGASLLILDEPTAVLTPQETDELFDRLLNLKKQGMTIIFISHKLDEVKRICDRITILKGGKSMGTYNIDELSKEEISNRMVGKVIRIEYDKKPLTSDKKLLEVQGISYINKFGVKKLSKVSLDLYNYEIVGIAGVDGNGQNELVDIITGNLRAHEGKVFLENKDFTKESIRNIRENGLSYVPQDRMYNGVAVDMSVMENLAVSDIDNYANKYKLVNFQKLREHCENLRNKFQIKSSSLEQPVRNLSGGNIQKVVVAREFSQQANIIILNEPTRGIDVGAESFIHHQTLDMREKGCGILLVSSDLSELIALSDRILVMYKGEVVASLDNFNNKVDENELGMYMLGLKREEVTVG